MKKATYVVVIVRGGTVQEVRSNDENLQGEIIDFDVQSEEATKEVDTRYETALQKAKHVIY